MTVITKNIGCMKLKTILNSDHYFYYLWVNPMFCLILGAYLMKEIVLFFLFCVEKIKYNYSKITIKG